jgi:hypothetical protein
MVMMLVVIVLIVDIGAYDDGGGGDHASWLSVGSHSIVSNDKVVGNPDMSSVLVPVFLMHRKPAPPTCCEVEITMRE